MEDITTQALKWNPQGKRGRRRPKNTWRRTALEEAKGTKKTWGEIKCDAKIECGGGFLWMPYVPQRNDGTIDRLTDGFPHGNTLPITGKHYRDVRVKLLELHHGYTEKTGH
jgi:hypothetical protein